MLFGLFNKNDKENAAAHPLNHPVAVEIKYGDETLRLETGRMAKQANGAVLATMGGTMVLATVCAEKSAVEGQDFFPLTVDYQEKFASSGRIPGSRDRREGKPSTAETLTARLIDRPIRPLFPETFKNKVQIIAQVFSYDRKNQPDILAMIASSAALALSGVPFQGPIGAARVGYIDGKYVLNPSRRDVDTKSEMDLVVAATKDGVLMVESEIGELDEETTLGAVKFGFDAQQSVIDAINELAAQAGKDRWETPVHSDEYVAMEKDFASFEKQITDALLIKEKLHRLETLAEIHSAAKARIVELFPDTTTATSTLESWADEIVESLTAKIMRGNILAGKPRIDGRDTKTVRPIEIELGVLPRAHGSALFTRGETQALVSLTLGGGKDALPIESLDGADERDFILNYNFPGYSVGEAKGLKSGRRELGHGNLAWRALHPMMPSREKFDYVVRVCSDILESNGSSSMATTCGATLAMMDGGVPLTRPVAGIAMGLIKEGDDYAILTDILGDEDHLGDMDFKVTGTKEGITALQMDIKITSITFDIMKHALAQARDGRMHILGKIENAIAAPRATVSEFAPQVYTMQINPEKIRDVIGKGGVVIQALVRDTNTTIDLDDDGTVKILATTKEEADAAIARIKEIVAEPEVGKIYRGVVSGVKNFGIFVKFMGNNESMVHISDITGKHLKSIEDAKLKEGDEVWVRFDGADERGKTHLSMKGIDQKTGEEIKK